MFVLCFILFYLCFNYIFLKWTKDRDIWWRVCYQQGLPYLISLLSEELVSEVRSVFTVYSHELYRVWWLPSPGIDFILEMTPPVSLSHCHWCTFLHSLQWNYHPPSPSYKIVSLQLCYPKILFARPTPPWCIKFFVTHMYRVELLMGQFCLMVYPPFAASITKNALHWNYHPPPCLNHTKSCPINKAIPIK